MSDDESSNNQSDFEEILISYNKDFEKLRKRFHHEDTKLDSLLFEDYDEKLVVKNSTSLDDRAINLKPLVLSISGELLDDEEEEDDTVPIINVTGEDIKSRN